MNVHKILCLILLLGILTPTSINQSITLAFVRISVFALLIMLLIILWKQQKISIISFVVLAAVNSLMFFFTVVSPFQEYKLLSGLYFLVLCLIFCLDFNTFDSKIESYRRVLQVVNLIWIILSLSIIFSFTPVTDLLFKWYSAFYDELLPIMLESNKPINTFGTHSIAGFYTFIFFFINYLTYTYLKKRIHLFISVFYMVFLIYIQSTTSLVYFLICFSVILHLLYKKNKLSFFFGLGTVVVIILINLGNLTIFDTINQKLFNSNNGLAIRYANTGTLSENLHLITENPFRGFGYSTSSNLEYIDSGFMEYTLKGSIFGLFFILLGLFYFLKRNLGVSTALFVFIVFISFEFGFANLIYFRSLFILPFVVAYINQLKKTKEPSI